MILCDPRTGSKELVSAIRSYGCEAELAGCELAADFQWSGNGPEGSVLCGIERKAVPDLLASIREKRLAGGQVAKLMEACPVRYLLVEGLWRRGIAGFVETGRVIKEHAVAGRNDVQQVVNWLPAHGTHSWSGTHHALLSFCEQGGYGLVETRDTEETAAWLAAAHDWWRKPWDAHTTMKALYVPPVPVDRRKRAQNGWRTAATVIEMWLHALPGMGTKAVKLAPQFELPRDIVAVKDWQEFDGIGKTGAARIREAIHGKK